MSVIADLRERVEHLAVFAELDVAASGLPESALRLSDDSVRELVDEVGALGRTVQTLQAVLAGVVARRSTRDLGAGGLSAGSGHRGPVQLIQTATGVSKAEAIRAVRVGESLLDGVGVGVGAGADGSRDGSAGDGELGGEESAARVVPWHEPLRAALLGGILTPAQHDAIHRGLGAPPERAGVDAGALEAAWRAAARELVTAASAWTIEQLGAHARTLRDMLDPLGAEERFAARFQNRTFRFWTDREGAHHGAITFDDEMGLWVKGIFDAGLRPRRGGPRFVAAGERDAAAALADDPRTNDQLAYDLLMDVIRAGALADAKDVFGAREPGVRLVTVADSVLGVDAPRDVLGRFAATGFAEDGGSAMPGSVIDRAVCNAGTVRVTVDSCGKPLDVGRAQRLFTPKQRVALAIRDGGCMWPGCDRPPSFCESHHCDPWAEGGATDCDVGILLCRFHHLMLHNGGWRISREPDGGFVLHPPAESGGEAVPLASKSPLRWLWDPPPDRAGWRSGTGGA